MCPTKKLETITPKEAWSGFKPNLSHLRVFCFVVYQHILGQLRKKLDDKGWLMILVGYHSTDGYKLYDASNRRSVISRDIIFYEIINNGDFVHFALMVEFEPVKMEEALGDPKWIFTTKEELKSIDKNNTWELVDRKDEKKPINVRWVFKVNANPKGEIIKHKARLFANGFFQREGINFEDVFTPVSRNETIRLVVGIANNNN